MDIEIVRKLDNRVQIRSLNKGDFFLTASGSVFVVNDDYKAKDVACVSMVDFMTSIKQSNQLVTPVKVTLVVEEIEGGAF